MNKAIFYIELPQSIGRDHDSIYADLAVSFFIFFSFWEEKIVGFAQAIYFFSINNVAKILLEVESKFFAATSVNKLSLAPVVRNCVHYLCIRDKNATGASRGPRIGSPCVVFALIFFGL
jgi:hypothetical protein